MCIDAFLIADKDERAVEVKLGRLIVPQPLSYCRAGSAVTAANWINT